MYPVVRASGAASPGSAGAKSSVPDTTAHATPWTFTLPATVKAGDVLVVFGAGDSGTAAGAVPTPSLAGHTFALQSYAGPTDASSATHGGAWTCELQSDGAKTISLAVADNPTGKRDNAATWVLFDGSSVRKPFSLNFRWAAATTTIATSTTHNTQAIPASTGVPAGDALALALLVNNNGSTVSGQWSGTRSYTAPSGWTKLQEIGSREFVDTALFTAQFSHQSGIASGAATYAVTAPYTGLTLVVLGAVDNLIVEHVASRGAWVLPGSGVWCDKPPGAAADDEASVFRFTGQSTARQRVSIMRFKNVHPTWPVLTGPTFGANTATPDTAHVAPDVVWSPRSRVVDAYTTRDGPGGYGAVPADHVWHNYFPTGDNVELGVGSAPYSSGTSTGPRTATYSVSAVWNAAALVLRAADDAASAVEVLIAWHSMDASQSSGTMDTPSWGGWTLLGTMTRVSSSGAANFKVYMLVVKAPRDVVWRAGVDTAIADTTGLLVGYEGTQTQDGTQSAPVSTSTGVPCTQAPGGRPGMACRFTIPDATTRYEHNPAHRQFVTGDDFWFSFSFYLDADFPLYATSWQVIEQLHGAPTSGSPVVAFEATKGQLRITGGANKPGASSAGQYAYDLLALDGLERERVYAVDYRVVFSDVAANSRLDVYVDGVQVLTNFQPPCATVYPAASISGGGPTYRKQGYYHDKIIGGGTVWHGGSALGRSRAGVTAARALVTRTRDLVSDFATDAGLFPVRDAAPAPGGGSSAATVAAGALSVPSQTSATGTTSVAGARTADRTAGVLAFTSVSAEIVAVAGAAPDGSLAASRVWVEAASQADGTRVGFEYDSRDGTLACISQVGGADASAVKLTYSPTAHRWWRVRNSGAFLIWETSPLGVAGSWTEQRRAAAPTWANGKDHRFSFETSRAHASQSALTVDNLNVVPLRRTNAWFAAA